MKLLLLLAVLITSNNCTNKENKKPVNKSRAQIPAQNIINYDSCKREIQLTKQKQKPAWRNISKTEKEKVFTSAVTETIIPGWMGTAWDFNGTSEKPLQGSIACGYFVTTILRDAGLSLARIKLAQCASEQMITSLVQSKYIRRFSHVAMKDFIHSIEDQGYGLYIVGLDNHTGFIYNDGRDIYFIHSSFASPKNVLKERAAFSWILDKSKYKVLAKISADEKVLDRWIN